MREDCIDHGCKGYGLGYATAWVVKDGKRFTTTKHRKIHYDVTGEWPEVVRHLCDNPRCINPLHLEGGTQVDNMRDCRERGRQGYGTASGELSSSCKLTDAECSWIRAHYVKGSREFGLPSMARKFGMGTSQMHRIIKGTQRAEKGFKKSVAPVSHASVQRTR